VAGDDAMEDDHNDDDHSDTEMDDMDHASATEAAS
jgi:hypothetical protein